MALALNNPPSLISLLTKKSNQTNSILKVSEDERIMVGDGCSGPHPQILKMLDHLITDSLKNKIAIWGEREQYLGKKINKKTCAKSK